MGKPKNKKRRKWKSLSLYDQFTSQTDVMEKKEEKKPNPKFAYVSPFKDYSHVVKTGAIPKIKAEKHSPNGKKKNYDSKFEESDKENCSWLSNVNTRNTFNQRYPHFSSQTANFQLNSGVSFGPSISSNGSATLAGNVNVNDSLKKIQNQDDNASKLNVDSSFIQLSPHRNKKFVESIYDILNENEDENNPPFGEKTKPTKTNLLDTENRNENKWPKLPKFYGELGAEDPKEDGWGDLFGETSRNKDATCDDQKMDNKSRKSEYDDKSKEEKPSSTRGYCKKFVKESSKILEKSDNFDTQDDENKFKKENSLKNNEENDFKIQKKDKTRNEQQIEEKPSTSRGYYQNSEETVNFDPRYYYRRIATYSSDSSDFDTQDDKTKKGSSSENNFNFPFPSSSENLEETDGNKLNKEKQLISRKHYYKSSKKSSENKEKIDKPLQGCHGKSVTYSSENLKETDNFDTKDYEDKAKKRRSSENNFYFKNDKNKAKKGNSLKSQKNTDEESSENSEETDDNQPKKEKSSKKLSEKKEENSFNIQKKKETNTKKDDRKSQGYCENSEETDDSNTEKNDDNKTKTRLPSTFENNSIEMYYVKDMEMIVFCYPVEEDAKIPEEKKEKITESNSEGKPKVEEKLKIPNRQLPDRPLPRNSRTRRRREPPSIIKANDLKMILWFLIILFFVIFLDSS